MERPTISPERFWPKVKKGPGCWLWIGAKYSTGYGAFFAFPKRNRAKNRNILAHRASVILHGRKIPRGFCIDHLCKNKSCVNPAHLRVVTKAINNTENHGGPCEINRLKTHCKRGHEFTKENIYSGQDKSRRCRACILSSPSYLKKFPVRRKNQERIWFNK